MATSLRGIGDVRKSFCEIDQSLREPIDVSHLKPSLLDFCVQQPWVRGDSLPGVLQTLVVNAPPSS